MMIKKKFPQRQRSLQSAYGLLPLALALRVGCHHRNVVTLLFH